MYGSLLTIITLLTISGVVASKWYLAKGILKPVYCLNITISVLHFVVNWMMFLHDSEQISLLLYNFLSIYAVVMSVKGLMRLKRESQNKS